MSNRILVKGVFDGKYSLKISGNLVPETVIVVFLFILCLFTSIPVKAQYALGVWGHPYTRSSDNLSSSAHFSASLRFLSISHRNWAKKWNVKNTSLESGVIFPKRKDGGNWYSNRWYLTGSLDFGLWNRNNWSVGLQPTFGIVWLPDQFDEEIADHHLLGSQLNNLFAIAPHIDWQISDRFMISGNIRLNHISNGGRVLPNHGLNYTTAGLGLYFQWKQNSKERVYTMEPGHRKFTFSIASGLGIKAVKDKRRNQTVNMWQLAMQFRPDYRIGWVLSTDYYLTWNPTEERSSQRKGHGEWPGRTLGLAPGIRLHFGKLKLVGQIGTYSLVRKDN